MATIYIHVGAHKTATSSIQEGLKRYRTQLLLRGIQFPLLPGPNGDLMENHSCLMYSLFGDEPAKYHINVGHGITTTEAALQLNAFYKECLTNEMNDFSGQALVLSGEDMILLGDSGIRRLRSFLLARLGPGSTVKVICYLRAPHDWFSSLVQQVVRGGAALEEAMTRRFPNIRTHIEPFVDHFGKSNIIIRKFEDAIAHEGGPVGHFLTQISEGFDTSQIQSRSVNSGLSAEGVELVSALNKAYAAAGKGPPVGVAREYLEPFLGIRGAKFVVPQAVQERVWQEARESLKWIESSFGISMYEEFKSIEPAGALWGENALLNVAELVLEKHRSCSGVRVESVDKSVSSRPT